MQVNISILAEYLPNFLFVFRRGPQDFFEFCKKTWSNGFNSKKYYFERGIIYGY